MCGRYNLITDAAGLVDFFEIEDNLFEDYFAAPHYNIAPGQDVPVVRDTGEGRVLVAARWGLVPHWSREAKTKYSTINARAETAADKPTYRDAFKRRRCLIPATGFYEWKQLAGGKTPYHIRLPGGGLFAFAGLWDRWERDGTGFDSCSIIVTAANETMRPIHDRMPVILNPAQYGSWLNAGRFNKAQLLGLLQPGALTLESYPVSRHVNSPRHDDPQCIAPA
jgi:putative SOS response-associated peptidase YedK